MSHPISRALVAGVALLLLPAVSTAELTRVSVASRSIVANGQSFGAIGPYEKIVGTVFFELDPADPHNQAIVDIGLAPRNARGRVEFSADLFILTPKDQARASDTMLFEISNRGGKGLLSLFNRATGSTDPTAPEHFGDGLLMRNGITLVWVGWEFDVGPQPLLSVKPPTATRSGAPIEEMISASFVVDTPTTVTALTDVPLYKPVDLNDPAAELTVRNLVWDAPVVIPRSQWSFVAAAPAGQSGRGQGCATCPNISLLTGFEAGRFYEVKYRASAPPVAGVGMAAVRDVASAFKHKTDGLVRGRYAHIYGSSQSGRFLRQFLYDGFNADEQNRKVFDGMMPHIAGAARGTFNTRFAQSTGLDQFAALRFPFTDARQADPGTGKTDGLSARYSSPDLLPRMMYTNSSVEYWGTGRQAALTHVSIDGTSDLTLPDNVRIYHFAGTQHGPAAFPPQGGPAGRGTGQLLGNPTPFTISLRALFVALDRWVRDGVPPPASKYSRLSDGTLTARAELAWPAIPGVTSPKGIPEPRRANGDGQAGEKWPFLVPKVDADGNEIGGVRLPDIAVPLGTYTGWNFRSPSTGNPQAIVPLLGSLIPFPQTAADRTRTNDPRRSVAERYTSRQDYLGRVTEVTMDLVREGYVLPEDMPFLIQRAQATWDWIAQQPTRATGPR